MALSEPALDWLARVRHDLVKRVLWAARDCRALGRMPEPKELIAPCIDDEGQPLDARSLWTRLRAEAPLTLDLGPFDAALQRALAAAEQGDVDGVLQLENAFTDLRSQR